MRKKWLLKEEHQSNELVSCAVVDGEYLSQLHDMHHVGVEKEHAPNEESIS